MCRVDCNHELYTCFDRGAINYAKWQLFQNELNHFAFALGDSSLNVFHKKKYPRSYKYGVSDIKVSCAELVELSMPLAVARPFVEEFISTETINTVSEFCSYS